LVTTHEAEQRGRGREGRKKKKRLMAALYLFSKRVGNSPNAKPLASISGGKEKREEKRGKEEKGRRKKKPEYRQSSARAVEDPQHRPARPGEQ